MLKKGKGRRVWGTTTLRISLTLTIPEKQRAVFKWKVAEQEKSMNLAAINFYHLNPRAQPPTSLFEVAQIKKSVGAKIRRILTSNFLNCSIPYLCTVTVHGDTGSGVEVELELCTFGLKM